MAACMEAGFCWWDGERVHSLTLGSLAYGMEEYEGDWLICSFYDKKLNRIKLVYN